MSSAEWWDKISYLHGREIALLYFFKCGHKPKLPGCASCGLYTWKATDVICNKEIQFYLTSYAPLQTATETQVVLSVQHAAVVEEEVLILSSFFDIHLRVGNRLE